MKRTRLHSRKGRYQNGNSRMDSWNRFIVMMMCAPGEPMIVLVDDEELARRKDRRAPLPS